MELAFKIFLFCAKYFHDSFHFNWFSCDYEKHNVLLNFENLKYRLQNFRMYLNNF